MSKKYRCIVADPAWSFGDKLPGKTRGAEKNYKVMTVGEICAMARWKPGSELTERKHELRPNGKVPAGALALCGKRFRIADDALLFLWRVSSQVEEAYRVCRAWGFEPKSEIVWIKTTGKKVGYERSTAEYVREDEKPEKVVEQKLAFGMGRYVRNCHETCIIAARGKGASIVESHSIRSVFYARVRKHSEKPQAFYDLVEALAPGPRLELFARKQREGWRCVGDQA